MDLDTALLRAFVAAAEHGNVGRAASELHLSQQGLSKRIGRLESALGVAVFERGPRGVALTEAGTRLLPAARQAIDAVDAAIAAAGVNATVTVDVMDEHSAAMEMVRAAAERPGGHAIITTVRPHRDSIVAGLLSGASDVAFGRASVVPWPTALDRRIVALEPLGLLVGTDHAVSAQPSVAMRQLVEIPLRFPLAGAPFDWVEFLASLAQEWGIEVDTEGCSLGFESFVEGPGRNKELATFYGLNMRPPHDPSVRVIPIVDPVPVFPWAIAWRRRWPASMIDDLVGTAAPALPPDCWMPSSDRQWLGL